MDAIEYVEASAQATLKEARAAYDGMHERIYKLVTLVTGGAGAVGVYTLGKLGSAPMWQLVPLAAVCCWWFLIAGAVLARGAKSNSFSVGTSADALRRRLLAHQARAGCSEESVALWYTRWDHLVSVDEQILSYSHAATRRARTLDAAYLCLICSPAVAAWAYLLAAR